MRVSLLALTAALFAAPTFAQESGGGSEKVISISFANGRVNANLTEQILVSETDAAIGLVSVPGKYWSNVYQDGLTNSAKSINATSTVNTIYDVATGAPIAGAPTTSVTFSAANGWSILGKQANPTSPSILHAYLDDGASGAAVTIPIVPFDTYDVIVYFATDNAKQAKAGDGQEIADAPAMQFAPVTVNGTLYSWQDGALVSGEAATDVPFGQSMQDTVVEGTNALRIPNLSGSLTIRGGTPVKGDGRIKGRGGIAALQIIGQEVVSSETLKDGVVYYSTFENTAAQTFNDAREQGTGTIEGATTLPYERLEDGRHVLNLAFLTGTDLTQGLLTAENQTFTIAFRADVGGNNNSVLFAFGNNTSGGLSATRGGANGTLFFRAGNPPTAYGGFGASSVSAGYHTYVVTYDATREKPYLHYYDASATASNKPVAPIIPDNTDFKFGSRVGGVAGNEANTESGKLDTFAVWNRVLTAREVAELTAQWAMPPPSVDLTWVTGSADWTTGLPGYAAGANVTFGANDGVENVVVPADTPAAGAVTVSGDYALGAENFGADSLEVTADGSLTLLSQPISARYVTFMTLSAGTSSISEFTLYRDGEPVNLEGMAVSGVESAANAVDGSTETEATFEQIMEFVQIDAGEGNAIFFDSYNVAAGVSDFPGGWYLLAGSTQTPNLQTDMKELMGMDGVEAPAAGAYLWETPRALSGSTGSKLSIEGTATIAGTLGGNGTVTAKTIDFAEGAAIKPTGVGYLTLSAEEITGATELVLDTSALNLPEEADPTTEVIFLFTSVETDFTFTGVPAGYRVRNLGGTGYVLTKDFTQPFSAAVSGTVNWENLVWTDANNVEIPPIIRDYLRGDMANLSLALTAADANARVYVDTAAPASLTINESEHQLTLASEGIVAFEPAALTVNGDLYVGDGALTLPAETTLNATLTYATFSRAVVSGTVTGTGSIVKMGTGTLAIAEGANVGVNIEVQAGALAPAANTTLVNLTLADGTTLDLSAGLPLAIKGTLTVPGIVDETDAPTITVNLATDFVATEEPQTLVTYAALASGGLEPADIVFTGVTAENWLVDFGATAITVEAQATIPLPEGVVGDETGGFSEDAQAAILGAVAGTEGVTSVTSVTLTLNGQSADTATFNDLAACVANLPLSVTVGENGVATVTAACNLTITSIEIADGKVVVAATLTGADGEAKPLTLKSGVKVELVPVTLDGTEPGDVLGTAEVGADGALTLPSPEATAGTVLFKVRLTPPTAQ